MSKRIYFSLLVANVMLFSCSSDQTGQKENANDTTVVAKPANSELSMLENKFQQDSTNFELRTLLAAKYYSTGDLNKAAYHFQKVYENDNKNMVAISSLGNIFYDSQKDDKAIEFYEKALAIDSNDIDIRCDLATCYSNINKMKKAIQMLRENIKRNPRHEKSHYNLSVILSKNGDTAEAEQEMKIFRTLTEQKK